MVGNEESKGGEEGREEEERKGGRRRRGRGGREGEGGEEGMEEKMKRRRRKHVRGRKKRGERAYPLPRQASLLVGSFSSRPVRSSLISGDTEEGM